MEGKFVVDGVIAVEQLVKLEAVRRHGRRRKLPAQSEIQRHALPERLFELVGQIGAETAADGKLSGFGQLRLGAGHADALRRRIQRQGEQQRSKQPFTAF